MFKKVIEALKSVHEKNSAKQQLVYNIHAKFPILSSHWNDEITNNAFVIVNEPPLVTITVGYGDFLKVINDVYLVKLNIYKTVSSNNSYDLLKSKLCALND